MKTIEVQSRYFTYKGDADFANLFVENIYKAYWKSELDMPDMFKDFINELDYAVKQAEGV